MQTIEEYMKLHKVEMTEQDVLTVLDIFTEHDIAVFVDGGWGVDALLAEQSRLHEDLDIAMQHKDVPELREVLAVHGYKEILRDDTRDCNFVLADDAGHMIDVHSYTFDTEGNNVFGVEYPLESLTGTGIIGGQQVDCIAPKWMVKFHTGYDVDMNDFKDVSALCERFGIELPKDFAKFI